ncbi:hypothetical protein OS493_015389 [Desmophyllum pertusum]|uniref:G-protein coupled receptors family 1 profile domain-containing protein n=1 Tax=Desmophyllum pertusum TaxID=174260 RepID=A0A9W9Z095_9CNID|nr:hypothetical protein OS493_015389 [Desmophyllum pertusum]
MDGEITEVFDHYIYNIIAAFYIIIMLATIVLNGIVIATFHKVRSLLTSASFPILSLAVADCLLAVTAMPLGIAANTSRRWFLGDVGCNWYAFSHTVVGLSSILHHAVIAVEAWRRIVQAMKTSGTGKRGMITIILVVWGVVITWGCMPLFSWSSYVPEGSGAVCSINWKSAQPADISYVICTFVLFLFVPVIVIIASYAAISHDLQMMAEQTQKNVGRNAQMTVARLAAKKKSVWTGVIMFVAAFFVWIPYAVVSFISAVEKPLKLPAVTFAITAMFAKTFAFINPIICFFWYKKFRDGTKKLLGISQNLVFPLAAILRKTTVTAYVNEDVKNQTFEESAHVGRPPIPVAGRQ